MTSRPPDDLSHGGTAAVLEGHLEEAGRERIVGWARDAGGTAVLQVRDNGAFLSEVTADQYRPDLESAGLGAGRHAFAFHIPGGLSPHMRHVIEVGRASDGQALQGSPVVIEAEPGPLAMQRPDPGERCTGHLDEATREAVSGWAFDEADPGGAVALQILDNGAPIARVLANRLRADLVPLGYGRGRHGFAVSFLGVLSPVERHVLQVRRERDGAELGGSPVVIQAGTAFDAALKRAVADAVAAAGPEQQAEVLSFMLAQTEVLRQRQADGEAGRASRRASGRDAALRALVIDERAPAPGRDAGSQAVLSHVRALSRLGYAVSFAALTMHATGPAVVALQAAGAVFCGPPVYASVEDVLRRQSGCWDVVYLHRAEVAGRYSMLARAYAPHARLIYSVADLHHVRLERQALVEDRPELLGAARRMRLVECTAAWMADATVTHSEAEGALLRRAVPEADVHVVGWDVASRPGRVALARRTGLAFIGGYAHPPNVDAALWLVEAVMPLVWQADPGIACLLVGSDMPPAVRRLGGPLVEVLGQVDDLGAAVFDRVRLTVAPLRFGAGVKGKVLESWAAGVPCVMTPTAAEGMTLPAALLAWVGADAAALAALIVRLHGDPAAHRRAVAAGRAVMRTRFGAAAVDEGLLGAIEGRRQAGR